MRRFEKGISLSIAAVSLVAMSMFSLSGCAKNAKEAEPMAGMPNPMVEVSDDGEFSKQLGFNVDTSKITTEVTNKFIIGKSVADVRFLVNDLEDNEVECSLRATKDDSVKSNQVRDLAGYYGDFAEPVVMEYDNFNVEVYDYEDSENSENSATIYCWNDGGVYCSLTIKGQLSQMRIGTILDECMDVMGMSPFA